MEDLCLLKQINEFKLEFVPRWVSNTARSAGADYNNKKGRFFITILVINI